MKLFNIECTIDLDNLLPELYLHKVIEKIDLTGVENYEGAKEQIAETLENSSEFEFQEIVVTGEADLSIWDIQEIPVENLMEAIENMGYTALSFEPDDDSRRTPNQNLHEELCDQFDLSRYTTKQGLLKHIHSLL